MTNSQLGSGKEWFGVKQIVITDIQDLPGRMAGLSYIGIVYP